MTSQEIMNIRKTLEQKKTAYDQAVGSLEQLTKQITTDPEVAEIVKAQGIKASQALKLLIDKYSNEVEDKKRELAEEEAQFMEEYNGLLHD